MEDSGDSSINSQPQSDCEDAKGFGPRFDLKEAVETRALHSLSVAEAIQYLQHHDISETVQSVFANERVDGRLLQEASDPEDFVELGVNKLHARLLMRIINEAKQNGVPESWLCVMNQSDVEPVSPPVQSTAAWHASIAVPDEAIPAPAPVAAVASRAVEWNQAYDQYHRARYLNDAASEEWLEQQAAVDNLEAKAYLMLLLCVKDMMTRASEMVAELQREALPRWLQSVDATELMHVQCIMGHCLDNELGFDVDEEQVASWWHRSADQGHADAQCWLGYCFHIGIGVPQDFTQAVSWYRRAAEQGHADAQYRLAGCYYFGWGVTANYDLSTEWNRISASQGHSDAIACINRRDRLSRITSIYDDSTQNSIA